MSKLFKIVLVALTILLTMACTIGYEGVSIGSDPDVEFIEDQTATASSAQTSAPPGTYSTQEPAGNLPSFQSSSAVDVNSGEHTYSVAATNFNCTCQVDGDMTVGINITGDQLEYSVFNGVPDIYNKVGENTYKRTFMGYYILSNGSGAQATETVVEEERHTMIILNDQGYIMEHYQGTDTSACCYHTFKLGTAP